MIKRKELISSEIENFILWFTSDDKEREDLSECLDQYMEKVWESVEEVENE